MGTVRGKRSSEVPLGNGEPPALHFQACPGGTGALMERLWRESAGNPFEADGTSALILSADGNQDIWLDEESVRLRLLTILPERGRLTNAEIRRLSGYSRTQVLKLMRSLREEGVVEVRGRGRGAHYVPAERE